MTDQERQEVEASIHARYMSLASNYRRLYRRPITPLVQGTALMTRNVPASSWIQGFQYWLKESEAPDSYIVWAAISTLAGATQRKLKMRWIYHDYYMNHYIMLVGPAGIVHKSSTIDMTRRMLREIGVPTASESLTREALIDQMIKRGDGITSAITALPDEFSDFIRPSGNPMIEFITSIYGSPDEWEYSTRLRGTEIMPRAFLNLLCGTTPTWIANEFDVTFTDQGFAARTLFVHELEPRFRRAKVRITDDMLKMYKLLIDDLQHISMLEGEYVWQNDEAEDWFSDWYEKKIPLELKAIDYRLRSYVARKPTHMLKAAMVLALSESDDLVITLDHITRAKILLDGLEASMARTFSAVGRNVYANDLERIAAEIAQAGVMSLAEVTKRNYSAMPHMALTEALNTLKAMRKIREETNTGETVYYSNGR